MSNNYFTGRVMDCYKEDCGTEVMFIPTGQENELSLFISTSARDNSLEDWVWENYSSLVKGKNVRITLRERCKNIETMEFCNPVDTYTYRIVVRGELLDIRKYRDDYFEKRTGLVIKTDAETIGATGVIEMACEDGLAKFVTLKKEELIGKKVEVLGTVTTAGIAITYKAMSMSVSA